MTTTMWHDDKELFALIKRELFSAVIGDCMDKLQLTRQFLPPRIRPLAPDMVVVGRAMTVLEADCLELPDGAGVNPVMQQPFGLMLEALDDLKPHEVYTCAGASPTYALWGELMSTRAIKLGAAGAVLDGFARDTHGILALNFPTFGHGSYAQDQGVRGRVVDYRVPIRIGDVIINPGDIVIGDIDGVCVVPREAETDVFVAALEKARGEKRVRQAILDGMGAKEAFDTFGIM